MAKKGPTKQEREKVYAQLEAIPPIPKGVWCDFFGGTANAYSRWKNWKNFPWHPGSDYVELRDVISWFRELVRNYRGIENRPVADYATSNLDADARKKEAQARKAELEVAKLQGELIHVEEVIEDYTLIASIMRQGLERLGRISEDAQRIMVETLDTVEAEFSKQYGDSDSDKTNGAPATESQENAA